MMKEYKKETQEIIEERELGRKQLERQIINANIAERDARRIEKQFLEDQGWKKRPEPRVEIIEEEIADIPIPISKDTSILEDITDKLEPIEEQVKEAKIELIEKVAEAIEKDLIEKVEIKKEEIIETQEELNKHFDDYIHLISEIPDEWINKYEDDTGKKAIWRGEITKGFKEYVETNGFI